MVNSKLSRQPSPTLRIRRVYPLLKRSATNFSFFTEALAEESRFGKAMAGHEHPCLRDDAMH
jgi:hypothetical protein